MENINQNSNLDVSVTGLPICFEDIKEFDGEARVLDLRIAERLEITNLRNIRRMIKSNYDELQRYGEVWARDAQTATDKRARHSGADGVIATMAKTSGKRGGRPATEYYLNEAQAVLICMKSATPRAADIREEIIKVFLAYRRGELVSRRETDLLEKVDSLTRALGMLAQRVEGFEAALKIQAASEQPEYHTAITYMPFWNLKSQRRPAWFDNEIVRQIAIDTHRQCTVDKAIAKIKAADPLADVSRSSLHRFWQKLDVLRGLKLPKNMVN